MPEPTIINSLRNVIPALLGFSLNYWRFTLAALSGVMLALPTIDPAFFLFSWFGFLPLFFSIRNVSFRQRYLLSLCTGLVLYLCSAYWILPFIMNMKGYGVLLSSLIAFIYWAYSAHVIVFIVMSWVILSKDILWERLILFPLLTVLGFSLFPSVFPVQLGVGQSDNLLSLQATDLVGIYGLDFIIALSNICLYELLNLKQSKSSLLPWMICGIFFSAWFAYGHSSIKEMSYLRAKIFTLSLMFTDSNND